MLRQQHILQESKFAVLVYIQRKDIQISKPQRIIKRLIEVKEDKNRIKLVFEINEGKPAKIRKIYIVGAKVFNENDLKEALNNNVIKGAACDVLSIEPCQPNNPLLEAKNLIITPHLAWATEEARLRLLNIVKFNIEGFIANKIINQIK